MLEGLEISEVTKNDINDSNRIDSEFYKKQFLRLEKQIQSNPYNELKDIASFLVGPFGSAFDTENYLENGNYRYVRGQDVKPFVLKDDEKRYLPEADYRRLEKYALKEQDILLSVVGTLGNACIVQDKDIPAIFSCKSTVIRELAVLPTYLLTYLNCKYGNELLQRRERGAIQKGLNLEDLKSILIPIATDKFQTKINKVFYDAQDKIELSKKMYYEAEEIFLNEIGLKSWKPQQEAVSVKSFVDFMASGRLDAEYYQPKYDELFAHLTKYDTRTMSQIAAIKKSIEPGSDAYQDTGVPFVRVSNLTKFGLSEPDIHLDRTIYETQELKPKKDTILLTKDGSVGVAYKLEADLDAITSGAILHLTITDEDFLPDYVTLVLNTIIVKMQAERDAGGSIIQHWKPSEIEQVIIPKLDKGIQASIAAKIQESFALKTESKRLLDLAKTAVELAIEQGEEKAIELLN